MESRTFEDADRQLYLFIERNLFCSKTVKKWEASSFNSLLLISSSSSVFFSFFLLPVVLSIFHFGKKYFEFWIRASLSYELMLLDVSLLVAVK